MGADMNKHNLFTSSSRKISIFFIKLIILLGLILAFLWFLSPQYSGNFHVALIDKVERLESIDSPKIVLIGNSNVAFGFNSEEIEEAFGMPVVNMGLHGALGNPFHEEMAKLNVCEGDIYIICHSNYVDDGSIGDPSVAWITIENHPELWKLVRREDIKSLFLSYPIYLKKCVFLWVTNGGNQVPDTVYSRAAFNEYGDIEWEDNGLNWTFSDDTYVPWVTDNAIVRINSLNDYLTERGATLLIAGYPIANGEYTPPKDLFVDFQNYLESTMDAPVISDFTDYFLDYKYFYNSDMHLNNEGKEIRTQQLIKDLENYLNEN